MNLEETIGLLANRGIEAKLRPILREAGISWYSYVRDHAGTLRTLASKGRIKYTQLPTFSRWNNPQDRRKIVNRLIMRDLENLEDGGAMVIPAQAAVFPGSQKTYMKKGGVLTTKPLIDMATDGATVDESHLHSRQLREAVQHISMTDLVVGYRFSGNKDVRFHTVLIGDILRAQITFENLDEDYIESKEYSGTSKDIATNSWNRSKTGATFVFDKVPSLSDGDHYKFTLTEIPAYQGARPIFEIMQAAFNIHSPHHDCEKTRYYSIKRRRMAFTLDQQHSDPSTGRAHLTLRPYESTERLMCHHIILATLTAGRYLEQEGQGWRLLNPFPTFNQNWKAYYTKLCRDVFKERRIPAHGEESARVVREPLTELDKNILLWRRMVYLRERSTGI